MTTSVQSPSLTALLDALDRRAQPTAFAALAAAGREAFARLGLPTSRDEAWRSTNLRPVAQVAWKPAPAGVSEAAAAIAAAHLVDGAHRLVFVNGRFAPELSALGFLGEGVIVDSLARVAAASPDVIAARLGALARPHSHPLVAVNSAALTDGACVVLPAGTNVETPIQLLFLTAPGDTAPAASFPRVLVLAGRGSQATLIETYAGLPGEALTLPVTELNLADGAVLDHYRIQAEGLETIHLGVQHARLERSSALRCHAVATGAAMARTDLVADLVGEGADCTLNGLVLVDGRQHADSSLLVHHAVPHCTSHQLYKSILDGGSRSVFTGRIVVDPGAQKTDARQTNRNLLLSPTALAGSNPQLEIFADDVRCTHGSTIGRLDEDAVFYLRSRGLDRAAAEGMLTWAFAGELLAGIRVEALRTAVERRVAARLPGEAGGVAA